MPITGAPALGSVVAAVFGADHFVCAVFLRPHTAHWPSLSPRFTTRLTALLPISSHPSKRHTHTPKHTYRLSCCTCDDTRDLGQTVKLLQDNDAYMGSLHCLTLQARLMAWGFGMLAQNVRCTILPSDFLRQPNRVYCLPAVRGKHTAMRNLFKQHCAKRLI